MRWMFLTILSSENGLTLRQWNSLSALRRFADESKGKIIEKLESLPTVIEIESARGIVGVVHADVPAGMSWKEFVGSLDNPQIEEFALWGRERIIKHYRVAHQ